jgi:hypothetical protein
MRCQQQLRLLVSLFLTLFSLYPLPLFPSVSFAAPRDDLLVDALVANLTHSSQHIRIEAVKGLGR